jgi:ABC-2 type transport system ATP-binding protein
MNLTLNNVTKELKKVCVLNNVNLDLTGGNIYGFVGENGSGKTMLFRTVAGLLRPTAGTVEYDGVNLYDKKSVLPNIGIIIENIGLYPEFSGFKNLKILASIRNKIEDDEIKKAIIRVGLDPEDKRTVKKYSLGMRQRLVIAQAIMEAPDILVLDEPTNALDEQGIEQIYNEIRKEKERGAIILIASHSKEDIKSLCDMKYCVRKGKITEMIE